MTRRDEPLLPFTELPVLMYHAVAPVRGPSRELGVPATLLGEHLDALRAAGYRLVGLSAALDLAAQANAALAPGARELTAQVFTALESADRRPVIALTFDDAYGDFLDALPVLADYDATATLYVPVDHVGSPARWLGDQAGAFAPILGWQPLRDIAAAGVEIGNHGLVHEPLDVMRPADMMRQVRTSRDRIAAEIGEPVRSFAYPHGYHSAKVRAAVEAAGHDNACEVGHRVARPHDGRFALPRLQPTPDIDGDHLLRMVRGESALLPHMKRLAQPGWRLTRRIARTAGVRLT